MTTDLWTDYWEAEQAPASTDAFPPLIRDAIVDRWRGLFGSLPAGSRILDVGTGPGTLVFLAGEGATPDHPLTATGVDLATAVPDTPAPTPHWQASFRGGIDSAALPFGDRSWSLVVSQFALEYGDFDAAIAEVGRVCAYRVTLLIHAAEGAVVRQNAAIADQVTWLLGELALADRLAEHVREGNAATAKRLAEIGAAMAGRIRETENPSFLQALAADIGAFLSGPRPSLDAGLARVAELRDALQRHGRRMGALAAAGRTPDDLDRACGLLRDRGFSVAHWTPHVSDDRRHLVGYWLTAVRPG